MLHLFYLISQSYSLQVYADFSTENTVWKCISMISYNILVVDFSEKNKIPTSLFISFRSTNHVCNRISENSLPVMYGWQIPQPWLNLPVISCTQAVGRWPGSTCSVAIKRQAGSLPHWVLSSAWDGCVTPAPPSRQLRSCHNRKHLALLTWNSYLCSRL